MTYYPNVGGSGSFSGWQCSACQAWVPWGSPHSCPPKDPPAVRWDPSFQYLDLGGRLLAVLERIAVALEEDKA